MIIKPRIKGFVCITAHPAGCMENVKQQAEKASQVTLAEGKGPKKVLVIGASTGYGLASRLSAAFASGAQTLGVSFEREPKEAKPGSAGFYNIHAFQKLDTDRAEVKEITIDPANESEIADTEKVMGGEDWELWTRRLMDEGLLADGCTNLAYSYVGPEVTWPIYRNGTIGRAKAHLESVGHRLNESMQELCGGQAFVSVNKAVVTQASSAIPVVPLYVSMLFKVMRELGTHEGCIEQTNRLFKDRLYGSDASLDLDEAGRIRLDDWEMADSVQQKIKELWPQVDSANLTELTNFNEYQQEFLKLFGFGLEGVDYDKEVDPVHPF